MTGDVLPRQTESRSAVWIRRRHAVWLEKKADKLEREFPPALVRGEADRMRLKAADLRKGS